MWRDLAGVSMLCADTTRSRAYLQNMARAGLRPARVLVLSGGGMRLAGQASDLAATPAWAARDPLWQTAGFDPNTRISDDLTHLGAPVERLEEADVNAPATCDALTALPGHTVIYSGFGGQILRAPVLGLGKRFLHVHGGYLPRFRGSTTNYYSLLAEGTLGASAIFMTAEIDAGPVLLRRRYAAPPDRTHLDHLHDGAARADVLCAVLNAFHETGEWPRAQVDPKEAGVTYYVVHPVLKHLAVHGGRRGDA
ncbi:hypothetical protein MWU52_12700 [Jannaschia sp. S6380]|uniref:formyltransferase family protein n=1 Tax=Jannaschia sp. S6380 TaxID=2926408 RepID=UPI001FF4D94E|nr:formyltransferase family protein [Jannaschia sp. S6380]MCK0168416.1 hypothetical protein [Jannaschia sp. S6380]